MRKLKTRKYRKCNGNGGCMGDIYLGMEYYPLRRDKVLCAKCGDKRKQPKPTWIGSMLNKFYKILAT